MNPERNLNLGEAQLLVIAMEIVNQNGPLSLKHPLCQGDEKLRREVEAVLNSLNNNNEKG